jgi:hypothetical protein
MVRRLAALGALSLLGCDGASSRIDEPYTLYHGSGADPELRGHWATFGAVSDAGERNRANCEMTARLLTDGYRERRSVGAPEVSFWCERGTYVSHL